MDKLDQLERQAIEAIEALQREYQRAAEPYVKQLMRIRDLRPKVYVDDGRLMIPIERASQTTGGSR